MGNLLVCSGCDGCRYDLEGELTGTRLQRNEGDPVPQRTTWFYSCCFDGCDPPEIGSRVRVCDRVWFVVKVDFIPNCMLSMQLQAPILDCPDCTVSIEQPRQLQLVCDYDVRPEGISCSVRAKRCLVSKQQEEVNGIRRTVEQWVFTLDSTFDVDPGMMLVCEDGRYEVVEVIHGCSLNTLPTVKARKI